ncbi:hypothetical protein [Thomasclavelia ramosa]|uniref:Uncharacterized protein n=1 Tax=Thomasclavelia ramosa TaxID=1547 RepID=A0A3E3EEY3_9FIRM|nr:hypothetical protein [Thomasclavelia ramosa]RGD86460.1 hypothetical protein DXB93_04585 [Thomasclavelia ramosa]
MKKMIRFEIKKAFDKKILFSVIVLLVINVGYIVLSNYNEEMKDFYYGKTQIVNKVNGKITQEKVNFLLDGLEKNKNLVENGDFDTEKKDKNTYTGYVYGDMNAFEEIYTDLKRVYDYSSGIDEKIAIINENIQRSNNTNKYSLFLKERLEGRNISSYYDTEGIESYLSYSYSFIFIIIIVVLGGVNYLYYDKRHDMEDMIHITSNGRNRIRKIRYNIMIFFTILISLLFFVSDYLGFYFLYNIDGLTNPIYSLPSYSMSYFEMPIFLLVIITILLKMLGIIVICNFILYLSKKVKSSYITILTSLFIALFLWKNIYTSNDTILSIITILKTFSVHKIFFFYVNDIYIIIAGLCALMVGVSYLYLRRDKMVYDKV